MYTEAVITCEWDKKWSKEKLDPCKCKITESPSPD